ncbi:MAG TPA: acetate--CoA ligase [Armatimonadota bacterium]|jgi:acetyl-CoA synthetase
MAVLDFEMTDRVLKEDRVFSPPPELVDRSAVADYMRAKGFSSYQELHDWSVANNLEFWQEQADELEWFNRGQRTLEWDYPLAKWFVGAECNIVYNCLDAHMKTWRKNKVAFYWEGENGDTHVYTYAELYRQVNRFANALVRHGLKRGDLVTLYMPRIPEQIIAMLAVARIGAVHSVVYSGFSHQALKDRIVDAQSKMVITADGYYYRNKLVPLKQTVDEAIRDVASVDTVIVAIRAANPVNMVRGRDLYWEEALHGAGTHQPCEVMDAEDMLYTLYTSGTTGRPKGIVHVHGGTMVGAYTTTKFVFDIRDEDVYWCTADPGWVTGHSYIVYGPLLTGATSIFYEGSIDQPTPGRWWDIIEKYGVTTLHSTPTAVRGLMRFGKQWPARYDLSSLRLLGSVGEPINPEAWMWYREVTGDHCPIMDTWWQTETGSHMICPVPMSTLKPGSATRSFLGIDADVVDKQGDSVPANKGGYLVIRKPWPSMMRTLFKDHERYETYWNTIPGVYFAGDAAHKDEDGYFWIQGRVDDVIKKSGYRLGTSEIESALVSHHHVAEAACIGKPDEVKGERIKAFVTLRSGYQPSDALIEELQLHVRQTVGPIAVPDEMEFVENLPKTRSGKIMRRLLKAKDLGQPIGDTSTLED